MQRDVMTARQLRLLPPTNESPWQFAMPSSGLTLN
jgi:hypothetical protein